MEDVFPKDQPRGRIREPELQSDLRLNLNKFHRSSVSPTTIRFNQQLQELEERCEKWHDVSRRNNPGWRNQIFTTYSHLRGTTKVTSMIQRNVINACFLSHRLAQLSIVDGGKKGAPHCLGQLCSHRRGQILSHPERMVVQFQFAS